MKSIDLETELTCSICTDLLYQPLTLLNCLHTFCGSCLQEWFGWQLLGYQQETTRLDRPSLEKPKYTCPSCRASVRETRPNATVTTLLDMYMQANPHKAKSLAERQEISRKYNPGESFLPPLLQHDTQTLPEERYAQPANPSDSSLVGRTRDMTLNALQSQPLRASSDDNISMVLGQPQQREQQRARISRTQNSARTPHGDSNDSFNTSQVSHQSSLRSLLSNSDLRSEQMTAEIVQQIVDEGLLDGVELDRLTSRQEDELSDMIAQAYRRRQTNLMHSDHRLEASAVARTARGIRRQRIDSNLSAAQAQDSGFDTTSPRARTVQSNLQEQTPIRPDSHTNASRQEQHRLQEPGAVVSPSPRLRPLADSPEQDLPQEGRQIRSRLSGHELRGSTEPSSQRLIDLWTQKSTAREVSQSGSQITPFSASHPLQYTSMPISHSSRERRVASTELPQSCESESKHTTDAAPNLICSSCGKRDFETEVHYRCRKCVRHGTQLVLCLRCYRKGVGCDYWRGFGPATWIKCPREAPAHGNNSDPEPPHILEAVKLRNKDSSGIQKGVFCDMCSRNANDCYWQCNQCNNGEWGFCHTCVIQARHCTHPLLPLKYDIPKQSSPPSDVSLLPLEIAVYCDLCGKNISPSATRLHCPTCNDGDYDVCNPCYQNLVSERPSDSRANMQRWRMCPCDHRMQVVGFEDERRFVVEDIVGGWALQSSEIDSRRSTGDDRNPKSGWAWKDDAGGEWKKLQISAPSIKPAENLGSISDKSGFRMIALWPYIPDDGIEDELTFPRGAEIREITDINGDWCWGYFCARGGLFPSNFGRKLD